MRNEIAPLRIAELNQPPVERIDPHFVATILSPYKPSCVYVKDQWVVGDAGATSAVGGAMRSRARMSIPESCYIDDTGHFNAVEFNICVNQMGYVFTAWCAIRKLLPAMESLDFEEYRKMQLPGILITELYSRFRRPINARSFQADLVIQSIEDRPTHWRLISDFRFWDERKGAAEGTVTAAFMKP